MWEWFGPCWIIYIKSLKVLWWLWYLIFASICSSMTMMLPVRQYPMERIVVYEFKCKTNRDAMENGLQRYSLRVRWMHYVYVHFKRWNSIQNYIKLKIGRIIDFISIFFLWDTNILYVYGIHKAWCMQGYLVCALTTPQRFKHYFKE